MKKIMCECCGSSSLIEHGEYLVCEYCHSRFIQENRNSTFIGCEIDLEADISRLLNLIKIDPQNALRYARLVLEIDPTNQEIRNYL